VKFGGGWGAVERLRMVVAASVGDVERRNAAR
jgi:hypothetical protein